MIAQRHTAFLLAAFVVGCAGGNEPGTGESATGDATTTASTGAAPLCVPGAQIECACLGGAKGVQVCRPDGSGYDACQGCDAPDGSGTGDMPTTADPTTTTTTTTGDPATSTSGPGTTAPDTTGAPITCPGDGEIDLHDAIIYDNPPIADWPVTTSLTKIEFTGDGVHVEFDKLEGPDRWPDIVPPGWDGPLQYTLGMAECIDGQWHASAAIQFWYGLQASGGNIALDDQVAKNWYYDPIRWGALAGRQPATGETIGIFVVAGNARSVKDNDPLQSPVLERSNVVLVPMPDVGGASHSF